MKEYLSSAVKRFKSNNYTNLTIVLGNESCDLDSAVSSIVYAIFLSWRHRNDNRNSLFIPLLDVNREDFALKTEVVHCLKLHNIDENYLIFRNDVEFNELIKLKTLKIVLVDHHVVSKKYDFLCPFVSEIIDHRPLDKREWNYRESVQCKVEIVGSCSTLIGQKISEASDRDFFMNYTTCAQLLHCVIILDTVNFSKQLNKATPLDEKIIIYLEELLNITESEGERNNILKDLLKARSDVSNLTAEQLLRKDLKILSYILVPSFPILVKDYLQKPKAIEAVLQALEVNNCCIALLLGMDLTEGLKRDGAIVALDEGKGQELAKFLQNWPSPNLKLVFEDIGILYYKQLTLSASRKQYMSALNEFVNK